MLSAAVAVIGRCSTCGLRCTGEELDRGLVEAFIAHHARYCVGGDRSAEVWAPYRAVYAARRRRVLVATAHPDERSALRALLESAGHVVEEAEDQAGALDVATALRPEVALVDVDLRGGGCELARRIRSLPGGQVPFLVALTNYPHGEDACRAHQAGFDLYLLKPLDPDDLERLVAIAPPRVAPPW